jgi:hypothetical protein
VQAIVQPIECDDLVRAHIFGHGHGMQAQPPSAHNDHRIALADTRPHQACGDRAHGAVDRSQ